MMTLPIISDAHGYGARINKVLEKLSAIREEPSEMIFLGDGARNFLMCVPESIKVYAVLGNCDDTSVFGSDIYDKEGNIVPYERIEEIGGVRVLMMHGHKYGVKVELSRAIARAAKVNADILLFGHTHVPFEKSLRVGEYVGDVCLSKPLHVFNPGALENGRFGLLTIRNGEILLSHGNV